MEQQKPTTPASVSFIATEDASTAAINGLQDICNACSFLSLAATHLNGNVTEQVQRKLARLITDANSIKHHLLENIAYSIDPTFPSA